MFCLTHRKDLLSSILLDNQDLNNIILFVYTATVEIKMVAVHECPVIAAILEVTQFVF